MLLSTQASREIKSLVWKKHSKKIDARFMVVLAGTRMKSVDDKDHHLQTRGNSAIATLTLYKILALHSSMTDSFLTDSLSAG